MKFGSRSRSIIIILLFSIGILLVQISDALSDAEFYDIKIFTRFAGNPILEISLKIIIPLALKYVGVCAEKLRWFQDAFQCGFIGLDWTYAILTPVNL